MELEMELKSTKLFQTPILGNKSGLGESRRVLLYMNFHLLKVQSKNSLLTMAKPRDRGFSQIFWAYPEANLVTLVKYSIPWLLFQVKRAFDTKKEVCHMKRISTFTKFEYCLYQIERTFVTTNIIPFLSGCEILQNSYVTCYKFRLSKF